MGIRSFLINFTNEKEIKKFLQFKDLISKIIADYYFLVEEKKGENFLDWADEKRYQSLHVLVEFAITYFPTQYQGKYQQGDWDLDLIGWNYWKGQIWGLIMTQTPGEDVFLQLMDVVLPNNYSTRLSLLPQEYDLTQPIMLSKVNDLTESLQIFNEMKSSHQIIDYNQIHKKLDEDEDDENDEDDEDDEYDEQVEDPEEWGWDLPSKCLNFKQPNYFLFLLETQLNLVNIATGL